MNRKIFLLALASVIPFFVGLAQAQQAKKVWRIGLFHVGLDHVPPSLDGLREGLKALGYEEGKNIRLDWRNLPDEEAARKTANEFVSGQVDLIVAFENQTARAAKATTSKIPVVFASVSNPEAEGLVKSLSHPGGNLTGFVGFGELSGKEMELFKELVPRLHQVLLLIDPQDPGTERALAEVKQAASALKVKLVEREVSREADIERVFGSVKRDDVDGVFIVSPNLRTKFPSLVLRLASKRRLPLAMHRKEWVEQGALFSYGPNNYAAGRDTAQYVDKILKGAKPEELPVQQPTRFEMVVNLKTAKALGLNLSPNVLVRADRVIK